MKTILRISYWLVSSLVVGWLSAGCNHNTNEVSPQGTCRIQQYTATSKSQFSNKVVQTTYTYDQAGNLIRSVSTTDSRPNTGTFGTQTSTTTATYTYNAEGYLTVSTSGWRSTTILLDNQPKTTVFSSATSYSYTSGRLTQQAKIDTGTYVPSNNPFLTTYEYDSNGDLTKMVSGSPSYQQIWVYAKNQLIDYIERSGSSENHPYTVQDGVITKMIFFGSQEELVVTALYDNQKRIIKREEYINNQLTRSDARTWTDADPASASLPLFKGFPVVNLVSLSGLDGVPATHKQLYWNSISKTMNPFNEDTYTVQINGQGFITGAVIVSKHPLAADQDYTTTETYTYTGCQ